MLSDEAATLALGAHQRVQQTGSVGTGEAISQVTIVLCQNRV